MAVKVFFHFQSVHASTTKVSALENIENCSKRDRWALLETTLRADSSRVKEAGSTMRKLSVKVAFVGQARRVTSVSLKRCASSIVHQGFERARAALMLRMRL